MIEFRDVTFGYEKGQDVLKHITFHIGKGEKVGLIGANGAGKSTVMKLLLGLLPSPGGIFVDGLEVNRANLPQIRKKLGFVLQNSDQQMFMPKVYDDMAFAPRNYGLSREETDEKIDSVLNDLDISYLKNRYNHKISGGEKRMAAIAVILVNEPEAVLMDEPTSALDPYNRRKIIDTIRGMKQTCLITSHDLDMILDTCERVILIRQGEVVKTGSAEDILNDEELMRSCHMELPLSRQR